MSREPRCWSCRQGRDPCACPQACALPVDEWPPLPRALLRGFDALIQVFKPAPTVRRAEFKEEPHD